MATYTIENTTSTGITLDNGDELHVSNGGLAYWTYVEGGKMHVSSGGTANVTNVFGNVSLQDGVFVTRVGTFYVSSGGTANETNVRGGRMHISDGGVANETYVDNGYMHVSNGGVANETVLFCDLFGGIDENGSSVKMHIYSGGVANATTVNGGEAIMYVSNGGTANETSVNHRGSMYVFNGGTANSTTVNDIGSMCVFNGGTANSNTVGEFGEIYVDGGVANSTNVNYGGEMYVNNGGVASANTVNYGGSMHVNNGGKAVSTTVSSGGTMLISNGGMATGVLTIEKGAVVSACDGGVVEFNLTGVSAGNAPFVNDQSLIRGNPTYTVTALPYIANGKYNLADGAYCFGNMKTPSGGTVGQDGVVVEGNSCFTPEVESGRLEFAARRHSLARNNSLSGEVKGFFCVEGANVTIFGGIGQGTMWSMDVKDNGMAYSATVDNGGKMSVSSGGTAHTTTVNGGMMTVSNGAKAVSTTIGDGGDVSVYYGGTVKSATVQSGGSMIVSKGGKVTGTLTIEEGATVSVNEGSILDFDISSLSPGNDALVNDLSRLQGTPTFTVTVRPGQTRGDYVLAGGAAEFAETLTVKCPKMEDVSIAVGEARIVNRDLTYALGVNDGQLVLTVCDLVPPDAPTITLSGDAWSQSAMLAAAWDKTDGTCLYAVDGAESLREYGGALRLTQDSHVLFQTMDEAGNTTDLRMDLLFGRAEGTWGAGYRAWRVGMAETAELEGLNIICNVADGSDNATTLVLTDAANGDALFMDDVYNGVPHARLSRVNEVFAGAGNDVVDMTSPRFEYGDGGITVHGGDGDDVIWANSGTNLLFGDAGSDRLVGGGGDDKLVGGAGDDWLHGGGGNDVFCFGGDWGNDVVEQASGTVTLWFQHGNEFKWNAAKRTYTDGDNSVTVKGDANVTLKFGDDNDRYAGLLAAGAFNTASSDRLFGGMGTLVATAR